MMRRRVLRGALRGTVESSSPTADSTRPFTSALPRRVLVWPSNCGSGSLTLIDGDEALADVLAGEVGVVVLEDLLLAGVVVEDARERRAEAGQVACRRRSC